MDCFKTIISAVLLAGLVYPTIGAAEDTSAKTSDITNDAVAAWITNYYDQMDFKHRGGSSISWSAAGLDSKAGATCRQHVHGVSSAKRHKIEHSAAYQRVDTSCNSLHPRQMKIAMKMGLVNETKPSPFVFHFALTEAGHKHVDSLGNGRYRIPIAVTSVEHVLSTKTQTNRYGVPIVDVTFTTVPKVVSWAKSYVGDGKVVSAISADSDKHAGRFWKTDKGWQSLYVTNR